MTELSRTSSLLWNIITLWAARWSLRTSGRAIVIKWIFNRRQWDVADIEEIQYHPGFLFGTATIIGRSEAFKLFGVEKETYDRLQTFLREQAQRILLNNKARIIACFERSDSFLHSEFFISSSKKDSFAQSWQQKFDDDFFILLGKLDRSLFLDRHQPEVTSLLAKAKVVIHLKLHFEECIQQRNEDFVNKELEQYRHTFDSVETRPLTEEQRLAAVYFEDVNVLVASAGSGKTSSLVGKAIYALKKKYFEPQEILMLAFASEAADGLKDRFAEALRKQSMRLTPDIRTFHSLGVLIIQTVEGKKPQLAPWAHDGDLFKNLLGDIVKEVCQDPSRQAEMTLLVSTLMFGNATSYDQRSYYQELFNDSSSDAMDMKNSAREKTPSLRTLNGEQVRSLEELILANWLSLNSIKYIYEKETEIQGGGESKEKSRKFKPDFYYPDADVYHEHFALNKDGEAPEFLGGAMYVSTVEWKRKIFNESQTKFFETHSAMFLDGTVFAVLKEQLIKFGLNPEPKNLESESAEFTEAKNALMGHFATIIKQIRNQGKTVQSLEVKPFDFLSQAFHNLILAVLKRYEDALAKNNLIDFEEMLIKASLYVENGVYRSPYKFICIDEFQDISQGRRRLVKALLDQHKEASLFAVGDDWQGIYRFAGADLDIFTRAEKYFGVTQELFLTNTFRSNQGIADAASWFVQKNPIQKKKAVIARDSGRHGVLEVLSYDSDHGAFPAIEKQLQRLAEELRRKNEKAKVFVLSRYKYLLPHRSKILEWHKEYPKTLEISTMTFHGSKGLEADYVFVLGMNSGPMGFPSIKNDNPFVQMYMPEADPFPYAEERRLFYVALTRAKKKAFLLTRKGMPSLFLQELHKIPDAKIYFA
ncbi:MAG: UvrD-helicase domain-containing protein [Bdellovibrio sp.]|nr:UvrD-helicase domain-containing protein [Bdellovibrio sp.]